MSRRTCMFQRVLHLGGSLGACGVSQPAKQELTCETVDDLPLPTLTVTNTIPLLFLLTILP